MNNATAATTVELHAIGGVEFRLVYTDCLEATCRACRIRPSHGPYWYATWVEDGVPQQCYVGKKLNHEELRQRLKLDGRIGHRAMIDLFQRMDRFERRQADEVEARRKADEERAAAALREHEADRAFERVRTEAVRKAQERANRATTTQHVWVNASEATNVHDDRSNVADASSEPRNATSGPPPYGAGTRTPPGSLGPSVSRPAGTSTGNQRVGTTASARGSAGVQSRHTGTASVSSATREAWVVLNLPSDSSSEDIKRRYRRLAKELHPDLGGDPDAMKRLNAAFTLLEKAGLVS